MGLSCIGEVMQSTPQTSEDEVQPVVAPTLAPNEACAPTSADVPTAASPSATAASKPDEEIALFGPAMLLTGEDLDSWKKLYAAVIAAVVPNDIFERIWARDVVDLESNVLRMRRLSAGLINATLRRGLEYVLRPLMRGATSGFGDSEVEILALKFTLKDKEAMKEVKALLEAAGQTWDTVLAQTMTINLENIERFDRMCTIAEARRDAALREIDRHREVYGQRLRRVMDEMREGEVCHIARSGGYAVYRDDQPA